MDELNEVLITISDLLIKSAISILGIRAVLHKEILEATVITRDMDEDSSLKVNFHAQLAERMKEVNHWKNQWHSKEHFNPEVLKTNWCEKNLQDKEELVNLENDCRSLAIVIRARVETMEKGFQIEGDKRVLCVVAYELYGAANRAIGYWFPQLDLRLKKIEGYMKRIFEKHKNVDNIATLLAFHGDRVTAPFMKKARELTGKSDSRIREYIIEAKKLRKVQDKFLKENFTLINEKENLDSITREYLQKAKASGKDPEDIFKEFSAPLRALKNAET